MAKVMQLLTKEDLAKIPTLSNEELDRISMAAALSGKSWYLAFKELMNDVE